METNLLIELNAFQTMGIAIVFLLIGKWLRKKVTFFQTYAIPAPVIGGLIFSIGALLLRMSGVLGFTYDETFRNLFMTMFFCSVGFNASVKVLAKGGVKVAIFLVLAGVLCIIQNAVALGLAPVVGVEPGIALMTGSTPMTGGHGTSGGIAPVVEGKGVVGAETVAFTAATFGLVAGSLMGGPVANNLIIKNDLVAKRKKDDDDEDLDVDELVGANNPLTDDKFHTAFFMLALATGVGTFLTNLINSINADFQMPIYIGPMILGILFRNLLENTEHKVPMNELGIIGDVCLQIFLAIALMTMRLWELAALALPLIILLAAQAVVMYLYAVFVTFPVMGRDYDAAVMTAGHCGFGMGATPNGVANMQSVTEKFVDSRVAFFVLPIVGGFFIDFVNVAIITLFLGFI